MDGRCGVKFLIIYVLLHIFTDLSIQMTPTTRSPFEAKIVGGEEAPLEKYAFAIQFINAGSICGGVILSSWSVLTAAHCFEGNKDVHKMVVYVASKYLYDTNGKTHKILNFIIHENYGKVIPFACDIGIILLKKNIKLNKLASRGIIVNHPRWMNANEKNFDAIGWGLQKYNGTVSKSHLLKTHLVFVPNEICSQLHGNVLLTPDMFCLYGDGERDTCMGDSGGGVVWNGLVVGLTSHGDGCAQKDKPSMYTNVYYFRDWIEEKLYNFLEGHCFESPLVGHLKSKMPKVKKAVKKQRFVHFGEKNV